MLEIGNDARLGRAGLELEDLERIVGVARHREVQLAVEVATAAGYTRPPLHDFFMTRYTEAYAAEIATFIAALSGKGKAEPSGEDGLIALALADAALKSGAEGRVVKLSEVL